MIDRWLLAEELWLWGEDQYVERALLLTDEQMVNIWMRSGERLAGGESRGGSVCAALATVELFEGRARPLARERRRARSGRPDFGKTNEERFEDVHRIAVAMGVPHSWT